VLSTGRNLRDVAAPTRLRSQEWGSCRRRRLSCSAADLPRTSPSGRPGCRQRDEGRGRRPRRARARNFITALEHAYDTEIGERGIRSSPASTQLRGVLRAPLPLIAGPGSSLLDEAERAERRHPHRWHDRGRPAPSLLCGPAPAIVPYQPPVERAAPRPHRRASTTAPDRPIRAATTKLRPAPRARTGSLYRDLGEQGRGR